MNDDITRAEERQLDVCLAEVSGVDLTSNTRRRIVEALHAEPRASLDEEPRTAGPQNASRRRLRWAASMLLGAAVVIAVIALGQTEPADDATAVDDKSASGPETPGNPDTQASDPQGKAKAQGKGKAQAKKSTAAEKSEKAQDPKEQVKEGPAAAITALIRKLELPESRATASKELCEMGEQAVAPLRAALETARQRKRPQVVAAIQSVLSAVAHRDAKRLAGFPVGPVTLIADYSDNRLVVVDGKGKTCFVMEEVYGAWDVELTAAGTLLVTEFSVSRVTEVTTKGKVLWSYENLRNPYEADRLPNGNTLIADSFRGRVIEVTPARKIVWSYDKNIRPFDVERLPNGNTLIANVLDESVIEVSPDKKIVWSVKNLPSVHDADRLPNGNTLITLRTLNRVIEMDRAGKEVFRLDLLNAPSDADRLPNGHTIVAENNRVRQFDRKGNVVWRKEMTWAVEVNRY